MATIKLGNFGYTTYKDIDGRHIRVHVEETLIINDETLTASVTNQDIVVDGFMSDDGDVK